MLLLLMLVMVSTGLAKALLLALVRLATLSSLRMTLVRWSHGLPTRTCSLSAPPQHRCKPSLSRRQRACTRITPLACVLLANGVDSGTRALREVDCEPQACTVGSKALATHCLF